jgi:hypothetical protein
LYVYGHMITLLCWHMYDWCCTWSWQRIMWLLAPAGTDPPAETERQHERQNLQWHVRTRTHTRTNTQIHTQTHKHMQTHTGEDIDSGTDTDGTCIARASCSACKRYFSACICCRCCSRRVPVIVSAAPKCPTGIYAGTSQLNLGVNRHVEASF